jgi:hypothetical protein
MFKKIIKDKNKNKPQSVIENGLGLHEEENINKVEEINNIDKLKSEIDKKWKRSALKGVKIKNIKEDLIEEENQKEPNLKKQFFSEKILLETCDPEERKKLLGVKREEVQLEKEIRKQRANDVKKGLFIMPDNLKATPTTKNDYVETLLKLSSAGLIEVPMQLEQNLKHISKTTNPTQKIDPKLAEEIDYLNVLKKVGPSYSKGYKPDISKKNLTKLNKLFGDAFVENNTRKRKLQREKIIMENQMLEKDNNI